MAVMWPMAGDGPLPVRPVISAMCGRHGIARRAIMETVAGNLRLRVTMAIARPILIGIHHGRAGILVIRVFLLRVLSVIAVAAASARLRATSAAVAVAVALAADAEGAECAAWRFGINNS